MKKLQRIVLIAVTKQGLKDVLAFFKPTSLFLVSEDRYDFTGALFQMPECDYGIFYGIREECLALLSQNQEFGLHEILSPLNLDYKMNSLFEEPSSMRISLYVSQEQCSIIQTELSISSKTFVDPVGMTFVINITPCMKIMPMEKTSLQDENNRLNDDNAKLLYQVVCSTSTSATLPHSLCQSNDFHPIMRENKALRDVIKRLRHSLMNEKSNHAKAREALESLCNDLLQSKVNS